jgi:hypothetical protein
MVPRVRTGIRSLIRVVLVLRPMVEPDERVLEEATARRRKLRPGELIELVERHGSRDRPGVARDVIETHAAALDERLRGQFDAETVRDAIDERLTESETWVDENALYAVGDRVSVYPARWHETLGGSTDLPAYVEFLREATAFREDVDSGGRGRGIPEDTLLDAISVIGRVERRAAKARLDELRKEGVVAEDADQHPESRVRLT